MDQTCRVFLSLFIFFGDYLISFGVFGLLYPSSAFALFYHHP